MENLNKEIVEDCSNIDLSKVYYPVEDELSGFIVTSTGVHNIFGKLFLLERGDKIDVTITRLIHKKYNLTPNQC